MRKNHVVKSGHFVVYVSQSRYLLGQIGYFHSFENAMHYLRYHLSFLGWPYGSLEFVDDYSCSDDSFVLYFVDREVNSDGAEA